MDVSGATPPAQDSGMATGAITLPLGQVSDWTWAVLIVAALVALVTAAILMQFFKLWLIGYFNNAGVTVWDLIGMRLRKVNASDVVFAKILLAKGNIHDVKLADLESQELAGGRVRRVADALIAAKRARIDLSWSKACAIDLAGCNIIETITDGDWPPVTELSAGRLCGLVGESGRTLSPLKPVRICEFGLARIPCIAQTGPIDSDTPVVGLEIQRGNLIVGPIDP